MVEHWSEKPGVDSSILSLGIFLLFKKPRFWRGFLLHINSFWIRTSILFAYRISGYTPYLLWFQKQIKFLLLKNFLLAQLDKRKVQVFRFRHTDKHWVVLGLPAQFNQYRLAA